LKHNIYVRCKSTSRLCQENKNLMDSLSVYAGLVPKACHNGACGVCRAQVHQGSFEKLKMNKRHVSKEDECNNIVLACRVLPRGDMDIEFLPRPVSKSSKVYVLGS